jgi:hypothetical protein
MKMHNKSKSAIAGLLAVAGSVGIGAFIIEANADGNGPPVLLCAYNSDYSPQEIVSDPTQQEACDELAEYRLFTTNNATSPVGFLAPVNPPTAAIWYGYPADNCDWLFNENPPYATNVSKGQMACFGESVAQPITPVTVTP